MEIRQETRMRSVLDFKLIVLDLYTKDLLFGCNFRLILIRLNFFIRLLTASL